MATIPERDYDCDECELDLGTDESTCRQLVDAVNVSDQRTPDGYGWAGEYQYVDMDSYSSGDYWAGEQCGNCGNTCYLVIGGGRPLAMACATDPNDEDTEGCGSEYPIVKVQSHYVVF